MVTFTVALSVTVTLRWNNAVKVTVRVKKIGVLDESRIH